MKVIKDLSEKIEKELDMAECYIKSAVQTKLDYLNISRVYFDESNTHLNSVKNLHEIVVSVITDYQKNHEEIPVPMKAIYDYLHQRHIEQAAAIKILQEQYTKL